MKHRKEQIIIILLVVLFFVSVAVLANNLVEVIGTIDENGGLNPIIERTMYGKKD